MATTDAKPGFRLPWSSDRDEPAESMGDVPETEGAATPADSTDHETPAMRDTATDATLETAEPSGTDGSDAVAASTETDAATEPTVESPGGSPAVAPRKPNKLMADLTRAMRVAADSAREEALSRLGAEAKTVVEGIHAGSANDATELRKRADDDVAAIRDWSKAEIARIREETDERISHRKAALDEEIEEHAASIEARVERVQARVAAFEAEMTTFFERLQAEEDPTHFATLAERMPEPPALDRHGPEITITSAPDAVGVEPVAEAAAVDAAADPVAPEAVAATPDAPDPGEAAAPETADVVEAADAADATSVEMTAGSAVEAPAPTDGTGDDLFSIATGDDAEDPRLAALRDAGGFADAEAESQSFDPSDGNAAEDLPAMDDGSIAARLLGLAPEEDALAHVAVTRVTVTGLISVASIAGFKRHLSRATGVTAVGVSSGPDGEFVFAVSHAPEVTLRNIVPTLPGFAARVTSESDGALTVAARDPEAEG